MLKQLFWTSVVVDGLPPLVKLLGSDNGDVKEAATLALANLTTGSSVNCV